MNLPNAVLSQLTDRSRKVLSLAKQEAMRMAHPKVGTTHLVLGIVKERTGIGAAAFMGHDVNLQKLRENLEGIYPPGVSDVAFLPDCYSESFKALVLRAIHIAHEDNHHRAGTEHLVLSLVKEVAEEEMCQPWDKAWQLLTSVLPSIELLEKEVLRLLGKEQPLSDYQLVLREFWLLLTQVGHCDQVIEQFYEAHGSRGNDFLDLLEDVRNLYKLLANTSPAVIYLAQLVGGKNKRANVLRKITQSDDLEKVIRLTTTAEVIVPVLLNLEGT